MKKKELKVLSLTVPALDSSECKAIMGGDGYAWEIELPEVTCTPTNEEPERPEYDFDDDIHDFDPNDYDYDNSRDGDSHEDVKPGEPLSETVLSNITKNMDPNLKGSINDAWQKGLIVQGQETHRAAAYYNPADGKIYVNDANIDYTTMAHEYTHMLQDQIGMMNSDDTGNANLELQANIIGCLYDLSDFMYGDRGWISGEHDEEWIVNHIDSDMETGVISVDQELWDWLNSQEGMNELLQDWLDYWANPDTNASGVYTENPQENWDYDWDTIFDALGIQHP